MWPFSSKKPKNSASNEETVKDIIAWTSAATIEQTTDGITHLMQLRMWGFTQEADAICRRLPSSIRDSAGIMGGMAFHTPSQQLHNKAVTARDKEELSREQVDRLQAALRQWIRV